MWERNIKWLPPICTPTQYQPSNFLVTWWCPKQLKHLARASNCLWICLFVVVNKQSVFQPIFFSLNPKFWCCDAKERCQIPRKESFTEDVFLAGFLSRLHCSKSSGRIFFCYDSVSWPSQTYSLSLVHHDLFFLSFFFFFLFFFF